MSVRHVWMIAACLFCECSRPSQPSAPVAMDAVAPVAGKSIKPTKSGKVATREAAASAAGKDKDARKIDDEPLKTEEREANPYSETVNLKLSVTPQVKVLVMWGGKQVARLSPGNMDAEISRPRGSGPLDLELKAEGFMPYHTRLYADRNDKVNVRLYRLEEAPGLLGYKRPADDKAVRKSSSPSSSQSAFDEKKSPDKTK